MLVTAKGETPAWQGCERAVWVVMTQAQPSQQGHEPPSFRRVWLSVMGKPALQDSGACFTNI
jgi:hypothetical protein